MAHTRTEMSENTQGGGGREGDGVKLGFNMRLNLADAKATGQLGSQFGTKVEVVQSHLDVLKAENWRN